MTEKIFDSRYMRKTRPEIPKYYQSDDKKRRFGIISPSCRLIHYDADFEIEAFKYMCWKRTLDRYQWKVFKRTMAKQEHKWTLVSERLPKVEQRVIFDMKDDKIYIGTLHMLNNDLKITLEPTGIGYVYSFENVIAWMPLPKPYKAESEGEE